MYDYFAVFNRNKRNIWQAVEDYKKHTTETDELDDISSPFVDELAWSNAQSKKGLRTLFSKSPSWNEELDAIVLKETASHEPDILLVRDLVDMILTPCYHKIGSEKYMALHTAVEMFVNPKEEPTEESIRALESLAPGIYKPGKKLSRVFKALCDVLDVSDSEKGSKFQQRFAQLSDELSTREKEYTVYISVNPAHFLTMSNPQFDERGETLVSCHSLNEPDYGYACGCAGYARDKYSFIVFTAADPNNPETLNNRKTTRQMFMYKPENGLLLQSRMYNTSGGITGAAKQSPFYRELVQRELSTLENAPNLWKVTDFIDSEYETIIKSKSGFGGYEDWRIPEFDAHVSLRDDHKDDYEGFEIGEAGLCVCCGEPISEKLYCPDCDPDYVGTCDWCEAPAYQLFTAYAADGREVEVCESCLDSDFAICRVCEDNCEVTHGYTVRDANWNMVGVCCDCRDRYYTRCAECDEYFEDGSLVDVCDVNGSFIEVCENCVDHDWRFETCTHCDTVMIPTDENTCPCCHSSWVDEDDYNDEEKDFVIEIKDAAQERLNTEIVLLPRIQAAKNCSCNCGNVFGNNCNCGNVNNPPRISLM